MRKISDFTTLIIPLIFAYISNNFAAHITSSNKNKYIVNEEYLWKKTDVNRHPIIFEGNDDEKIFNYLKISNIITSIYLDLESPDKKRFENNIYSALENKTGACFEYALCTYYNFRFFINLKGEYKLLDNVRVVSGYRITNNDWGYHEWIEYKQNGGWKTFETLKIDEIIRIRGDLNIDLEYVLSHIGPDDNSEKIFNNSENTYYPLSYVQKTKDGEIRQTFCWWNMATDTKGGLRVWINNMIRYH